MKTASQWFNPDGESNDIQESKTTENIALSERNDNTETSTTTSTATTTTSTAGKRIDYSDDYYYDDSEDNNRPYRADVIDAVKPLAVR
jgi:hypothetical protein